MIFDAWHIFKKFYDDIQHLTGEVQLLGKWFAPGDIQGQTAGFNCIVAIKQVDLNLLQLRGAKLIEIWHLLVS
jgi:hypothetical protein